jgi:hypothetical protein
MKRAHAWKPSTVTHIKANAPDLRSLGRENVLGPPARYGPPNHPLNL